VKVIFDQNIPRRLRDHLPSHEVKTAREMGWAEARNGEFLRAAEDAGFNIFVTADQNLSYQQNLDGRKIAIVMLTKNNWPKIRSRIEEIVAAINRCRSGEFMVVDCGR
jgi:predicted nuclease of predicted toxin-antitoxin system